MKILFISMPSVHAIRWIENLKDTAFELYWYDVTNRGKLNVSGSVKQFAEMNQRKRSSLKGEYTLSKKFPELYERIRPLLEVTENEALEKIIHEIKPDVIHSFEMQTCSYPILKTMNKFPNIKWIYSCWGSDLFYYRNIPMHNKKIKNVLKRVNFIHTDCQRDFDIAKELGFKGTHLGNIPGGSGYDIEAIDRIKIPVLQRKIILVKGYQHFFGRALNVVKALEQIQNLLTGFDVVIFGAHQPVADYVENKKLAFKVLGRNDLLHPQMMELMSKSLIYIGNSISDGMPNTMLEAMVCGAFPIQSNPGNVTAEVITDGSNGLLIDDPENITAIAEKIAYALANPQLLAQAAADNHKFASAELDYKTVRKKIITLYSAI